MNIHCTARRRRAVSLIETLVVISVFSVTISVVAFSLRALQQTSQRITESVDYAHQRNRLATQLRADAHEAHSVRAVQAKHASDLLLLQMADNVTIRYQLLATEIQRFVEEDGATQQFESYFVRPDRAAGWRIDTQRRYPLVTLQLRPLPLNSAADDASGESHLIAAAVGITVGWSADSDHAASSGLPLHVGWSADSDRAAASVLPLHVGWSADSDHAAASVLYCLVGAPLQPTAGVERSLLPGRSTAPTYQPCSTDLP